MRIVWAVNEVATVYLSKLPRFSAMVFLTMCLLSSGYLYLCERRAHSNFSFAHMASTIEPELASCQESPYAEAIEGE